MRDGSCFRGLCARGPRLPVALAALLAWALPLSSTLRAGALVDARFELKPPQPYVGQPFEMHLRVEVTPGAELQDLSLSDANYDDVATVQSFQTLERTQARHDDRTVDVIHYVSTGRALKPAQRELAGVLHATVVERHTMGFFSSWSSSSGAVAMHRMPLLFRPLPTTGIPAGFQGAIGTFSLEGRLNPAQAAPGDIVNIEYRLSGQGWLGNAQLVLPPLATDFRSYPPQEIQRDETGHLTVRQVVIPLTTNTSSIAAARLPYFDPAAGRYREAVTGPLTLRVLPVAPGSALPAERHVAIQPSEPDPSASGTGGMQVTATLSQARRLLPLGAALLLSTLLAGLIFAWRPRIAVALGILLFVATLMLTQHWMARTRPVMREVRMGVAARLCPSAQARTLFHLATGRPVALLETSGGWVRIDAAGRRGWVPVSALAAPGEGRPGTPTETATPP